MGITEPPDTGSSPVPATNLSKFEPKRCDSYLVCCYNLEMEFKPLMLLGGTLMACSFSLYSLINIYGDKVSDFQVTLFTLILLEILGALILVVSLIIWSFSQSAKIKKRIWILLGILIFIMVIPFTTYCPKGDYDNNSYTYDNDVVICELVYPYQPYYWLKVFYAVFDLENPQEDSYYSNRFVFFGITLVMLEKYDDTIESISRVVK